MSPGLTCSADAQPVLERIVGQAIGKSRAGADVLAQWAMPRTAMALRHGRRQDVLSGPPSQTAAHVPSATGTGVHLAVESLVTMSSDEAGKRMLGLGGDAR
jgi:hypothetical protein